MLHLEIRDTFSIELPSDKDLSNSRRQVYDACFSYVSPSVTTNPQLVHVSDEMMSVLGLDDEVASTKEFLNIVSGAAVMIGTKPYAMCYGGHQFGNWAGQLGDGRAINLFEMVHKDRRWALQLKGAGETPYSRTADGLAVLRSSIREHLCSEAMYHLGIPTTRSLSLSLSGNEVMRDVMYDGNPALEKGAIVCRVAPSFIRFGSFQIFASRKDSVNLRRLTDYTIKHFYTDIDAGSKEGYINFFNEVVDRSLEMVVHWQRVGFVHGVMNTDNMSILGLTIDYGPYGWLEGYDKNWTPNTTDKHGKRYRFGNQAPIVLWNLYQLANALMLLIEDAKPLEEALEQFKEVYLSSYNHMMRTKLGLELIEKADYTLIAQLEEVLALIETDMTIFFRLLSNVKRKETATLVLSKLNEAFYNLEELNGKIKTQWEAWINTYIKRLNQEERSDQKRKAKMDKVNPKYVLRNYMAQIAIGAADKGDYSIIDELYKLLKQPYAEQSNQEKWFVKRPEWARYKVGCSMLSCSS